MNAAEAEALLALCREVAEEDGTPMTPDMEALFRGLFMPTPERQAPTAAS